MLVDGGGLLVLVLELVLELGNRKAARRREMGIIRGQRARG